MSIYYLEETYPATSTFLAIKNIADKFNLVSPVSVYRYILFGS